MADRKKKRNTKTLYSSALAKPIVEQDRLPVWEGDQEHNVHPSCLSMYKRSNNPPATTLAGNCKQKSETSGKWKVESKVQFNSCSKVEEAVVEKRGTQDREKWCVCQIPGGATGGGCYKLMKQLITLKVFGEKSLTPSPTLARSGT